MRFRPTVAAFTFLTVLSLAPFAEAADEPPVVQSIFRTWEQQFQAKPTYRNLETDSAGNVTIEGVAATISSQDPAQPGTLSVDIGKIQLMGIADQGGGLFEVASTKYDDLIVIFSGPDGTAFTVRMPESSAEGWYVTTLGPTPTPNEIMRASMNVARRMNSGPITIDAAGQTFTVAGYESTWSGDPATGAGKFDVKISSIAIPAQAIAMLDPTGELKKLGYNNLSFNMGGTGNLTITGDTMGFDADLYFEGRDAGTLRAAFAAANVPIAAYAEFASPGANKEPDFNKLMPQLLGVTVSKLQLRFDDGSLTKRLLPILAKQQNMDEAGFVASAGAMLQITLAQLKNQAFTDSVVGAVTSFLKDPKSIALTIQPPQPIAVQQLMTMNPADPGAAITSLGVTVTANE
ncbi:MAG: hypothetical protein JNM20_01275 [Rhizobiales bacterium]|nr:hypothetical protein [Hyphomicrobiales bacterium]